MRRDDIERSITEIGMILCGSGIDRVHQLNGDTFLFSLYGAGKGKGLLVSPVRKAPRFHLLFEHVHKDHYLNAPSAALLNKHCARAKIMSIHYRASMVELILLRGVQLRLRLYLNEGDMQLVEGDRELFRLQRVKLNSDVTGGEAIRSFARSDIMQHGTDEGELEISFNRSLSREFLEQQNRAIERKTLSVLRGERKKLGRLMDKLLEEQRDVAQKDLYRHMGELLKYNLPSLKKGQTSVSLAGFDGKPVRVDLDPRLGPRENMEALFQRYRKLKRREEFIDAKIAFEKKRSQALDELIEEVRSGGAVSMNSSPLRFVENMDVDLLTKGLQQRLRRAFWLDPARRGQDPVRNRDKEKVQKHLSFHSISGKHILVGRNARENDELTMRMARGNDLWFHVETGSGSHVILRHDRGSDFQDADILDAAMLALYFSNYRNKESGDVVYTLRKYVRKPKKSPAGHVTYHNNKTKHVRIDQRVLDRLLDSRPRGLALQK
jgi:predicted ribosome quality control (RQC) complex YloA/Tae2 family protein